MKRIAKLITTFLIFTLPIAHAQQLSCQSRGNGFGIYNHDNQKFLGGTYYNELYYCRDALATRSGDYVCGPYGTGSSIYQIQTGTIVGENNYWYEVQVCAKAMKYYKGGRVICAPRASGSGLYDLVLKRFVGNGFYYEIRDCTWASSSEAFNDDQVCAPYKGLNAIYDLNFNAVTVNRTFTYVQDCYYYLR